MPFLYGPIYANLTRVQNSNVGQQIIILQRAIRIILQSRNSQSSNFFQNSLKTLIQVFFFFFQKNNVLKISDKTTIDVLFNTKALNNMLPPV